MVQAYYFYPILAQRLLTENIITAKRAGKRMKYLEYDFHEIHFINKYAMFSMKYIISHLKMLTYRNLKTVPHT